MTAPKSRVVSSLRSTLAWRARRSARAVGSPRAHGGFERRTDILLDEPIGVIAPECTPLRRAHRSRGLLRHLGGGEIVRRDWRDSQGLVEWKKRLSRPSFAGPAGASRTATMARRDRPRGSAPALRPVERRSESNSLGTHEFARFCKLVGAEPYFAANVGPHAGGVSVLGRVLHAPGGLDQPGRRAGGQRLAGS